MSTLILGQDDLRQIVHRVGLNAVMDELIERLEEGFRNFDAALIEVPARSGFNYELPYTGLVEWMPLIQHGKNVTLKVVGYHPQNPSRAALPSVLSTVTRYDVETGRLLALIDGTFPTVLRTAAASVVASRALAHPESSVLGLIGSGAQAISQTHALARFFPLQEVLYFDIDQRAQDSFSRRVYPVLPEGVALRAASIEEIVASSDILCTSTSIGVGEGPLFGELPYQAHLHINAVGSDFPGKTELPLAFLERAMVCPDFLDQAVHEGECQQLKSEQIGEDLVAVVALPDQCRGWQQQLTVFDSTGYALEDDIAMTLFLDLAERFQIGKTLDIESHAADPKDPYQFLWPAGSLTNATKAV